ncbi:anthranilate O-methyltransferase 1-like isoform X1 [Oryza brachyantha]|uniref:anthranilate O-methyltransferase 1-like isoform X1 n=1 Tax=Oryza brachyantha TaxID=4533 RepID=UPI001ADA939B|nr:anthranilate O-methyltransferase 1-like isoform X1 [Oryza brachyantha]
MKIERDLHMVKGDGEFSYAKNSMIQRRAVLIARPILEKAVREVCRDLHPQSMVIADLGCSSGKNTLLFISEVLNTICESPSRTLNEESPMEVQFFLNDLPGNDFNHVFQSLEQLEQECACRGGLQPPPYYVAGLPGSFYTRLFPCNSVHLFHSSISVMWLSQVPEHLGCLNEGNVHIGASTHPAVARLYQDQFEKDFSRFLQMRCREIVPGGRMVLTVVGRKREEVFDAGGTTKIYELLSQGLRTLVSEGRVEKEKLDSFNIPMYWPSTEELKQLVQQNGLLHITDIHLFEMDGSPTDESPESADGAPKGIAALAAGERMSATLRAGTEPLIVSHFGESLLDDLFALFARYFTSYIESEDEKSSIVVITMSLEAKH